MPPQIDLRAALPHLLPRAIAWAKECADEVARGGVPLDARGINIARKVGVSRPELVRVATVEQLPSPSDLDLQEAAIATGLLRLNMVGLTLGHGIFVCRGQLSIRLLSHECRHVHQYEQAGSIEKFLPTYLQQVVEYGYATAPLEIDARNHEIHR